MSHTIRKAPRSVFIICEAGSDIHVLMDVMQSLGLRTLNDECILTAEPIATATDRLIAKAELVCVVLKETNSPNVYLELGFALGLNRPVVVIGEPASFPMGLADLFWIKAPIDDRPALTFQLSAALANFDSLKPARKKSRQTPTPQRIPESGKLLSSGGPDSEAERALLAALETSPEIGSIVRQPREIEIDKRGYVPDLAIWPTASNSALDGPTVIELKIGPSDRRARELAVERLQAYARASDIKSGIFIHGDRQNPNVRVVSLSPLTFAVEFEEIRRLLAEERLFETLRRERNRFVHSAG